MPIQPKGAKDVIATIEIEKDNSGLITIDPVEGPGNLSTDPEKNVCGEWSGRLNIKKSYIILSLALTFLRIGRIHLISLAKTIRSSDSW